VGFYLFKNYFFELSTNFFFINRISTIGIIITNKKNTIIIKLQESVVGSEGLLTTGNDASPYKL